MLEETREKAQAAQERAQADQIERASAYHRAFIQNESGKKVLDGWVQRYCMTPISRDASHFQCGVAEGKRELIKEILDQISYINNRE